MPAYYLVNTNEKYRPESRNVMLEKKCIFAQCAAKTQIDVIERNDVVFIYQNGMGIIAVGIADGQVQVQDYAQKPGNRHLMNLLSLQEVNDSVPPSTITEMVHQETGKRVYYARTVVPLPPETGRQLHQLATGMISKWEPDDFLQLLNEDQQDSLSEFLEVELEDINRKQRIILIAEAYDYALLVGTEWLSEQYGLGIVCCRIAVATDSVTKSEYLVCSNVYPAPELAKVAIARRGSGGVTEIRWSDWESALSGVTNNAVTSYFKKEIAANRDSYLPKRIMRYSVAGKRRWHMAARNKNAYVWQLGRFEGDIDFWRNGLSKPDVVKPVKNDECLRLFLNTPEDFQYFHNAVIASLQSTEWIDGTPDEEMTEGDVAVAE